MILTIYVFLIIFALSMVAIGYYSEVDVLKLMGFFTLFLMAFPMLTSAIQYESGEVQTVAGNVTTIITNYANYGNVTIGIFTAIIALFGFATVFYQYNNEGVD